MAHVVVGSSPSNAQCQRQHGLRAIQRLKRALLVRAQPHYLKQRILVEANNIVPANNGSPRAQGASHISADMLRCRAKGIDLPG